MQPNSFFVRFFLPFLIVLPVFLSIRSNTRPLRAVEPQFEDGRGGIKQPIVVRANDQRTIICSESINHQELINLSHFSPYLVQAVIASEDSRFDWHLGIDPIALLRAMASFVKNRKVVQGGSTITQQVARTVYSQEVGSERTIARKLKELFYALQLEFAYNKDEILSIYLNRVFLGGNNYGFEAASQAYFDKASAFLDINESATLVSILPAPNGYALTDTKKQNLVEEARNRRNIIVSRMKSLGFINSSEHEEAKNARVIEFNRRGLNPSKKAEFPNFCKYILSEELPRILSEPGVLEGGLYVDTTLRADYQKKAEEAVQKAISYDGFRYNFNGGGLVHLGVNGEILAMVGKRLDPTISRRQPGSTFKVFTYAAALEQGYKLSQEYSCQPLVWKEQNYKRCERSPGRDKVTLEDGLVWSENVISLRLAQEIGLASVANSACQLEVSFGYEREDIYCEKAQKAEDGSDLDPGLVLGQEEVTLLDMVSAYTVFGNKGYLNEPYGVTKIRDRNRCTNPRNPDTCYVIYDSLRHGANSPRKVLSEDTVNSLNSVLQESVKRGTGRFAKIGIDEAGKTGTTDEGKDMWFIGYSSSENITSGVWLGNEDNSATKGSSEQAAQLWSNYMKKVLKIN